MPLLLLLLLILFVSHAFQPVSLSLRRRLTSIQRRRIHILTRQSVAEEKEENEPCNCPNHHNHHTRRKFWRATGAVLAAAGGSSLPWSLTTPSLQAAAAVDDVAGSGGVPVVQTPSGLKYIDIVSGTGPSPAYGNLVSIAYTGYVKLPPNSRNYPTQPQKFDQVDAYLLKHGNGRTIAGLDEGLHSMKVGGKRRIIIPPKLGFVDVGLGPMPELPWNRWKLDKLLDQTIELVGGTVIYEVTLLAVVADEADQGYYQDSSLSPEDFATLRENLRLQGNAERVRQQAAAVEPLVSGQDRVR